MAHTTVELTTNEFLIAHGPSKWLSAEQVDKFRRQKRVGRIKHTLNGINNTRNKSSLFVAQLMVSTLRIVQPGLVADASWLNH